jgi:hypothetical protein
VSSLRKLTLSVDASVIERARRYSQRHDTSISRLVTQFLSTLDADEPRPFSPVVERLLGILPASASVEEYHEYLVRKYGA